VALAASAGNAINETARFLNRSPNTGGHVSKVPRSDMHAGRIKFLWSHSDCLQIDLLRHERGRQLRRHYRGRRDAALHLCSDL